MELSSVLRPQAVKVLSAVSSKKRLFQHIGDIAEVVYGISSAIAVDALLEREALGPTGVGHGVALPHARVHGLDDVIGTFVLLEKPIEFDSVDRQPVDIAFGLFAPEDAGVDHLKALALVSRTLRDSERCAKLRANSNPTTLYVLLTEGRPEKAA